MKSLLMLASFFIYAMIASMVYAEERDDRLDDKEYMNALEQGVKHSSQIKDMFHERMTALGRGLQCGDIVIAEGDSWFDYRYREDIVSKLESMGWAVYSSAHYGDTLESMLYDDGQLESLYTNFVRIHKSSELAENSPYIAGNVSKCLIERRNQTREYIRYPKAILLSAGGNDILGKALAFLLEHNDSSASEELNDQIKKGLFVRIDRMLVEYISTIRHLCTEVFERNCNSIPIFVHGYDYVKPTGEAYFKFIIGPGPWLKSSFDEKKHTNINKNATVIKSLVDDFNTLLCERAKSLSKEDQSYKNPVFYIEFLEIVMDNWEDEIHPNGIAAEKLAKKISENIVKFHENTLESMCIE